MIKQWITVQGTAEWNEDAVIINEANKIYGVVDGATSIVPFRGKNNETGGRLASQSLKTYFESILPGESRSLEELLNEANRRLGQEMQSYGISTTDELWTAAIAAVRITETHIEFVQSGDCLLFAIYKDGSIRSVCRDHIAPIELDALRIWQQGIAEGIRSKAELWEKVLPQLVENKRKMNTPEGYSVINGRPDAELYLESGKLNRVQLKELLLITDGLYFPGTKTASQHHQTDDLVRQMTSMGLEEYAQWLTALEHEDEQCIRYPRFKTSDDKSAIWIDLTN